MTYCNGETSIIRPDLTSPGAYLTLFLGESLISQPSGEVHTPVWSQAFMGPVGHSDPLYEGSPMEADSFWRCTGSAGVRPSVESGKDTKAKELIPCPRNAPTARATSASAKTAGGRVAIPRATTPKPASASSKMSWEDPDGVQSEAGRRHGGRQGRRCQPRR